MKQFAQGHQLGGVHSAVWSQSLAFPTTPGHFPRYTPVSAIPNPALALKPHRTGYGKETSLVVGLKVMYEAQSTGKVGTFRATLTWVQVLTLLRASVLICMVGAIMSMGQDSCKD